MTAAVTPCPMRKLGHREAPARGRVVESAWAVRPGCARAGTAPAVIESWGERDKNESIAPAMRQALWPAVYRLACSFPSVMVSRVGTTAIPI